MDDHLSRETSPGAPKRALGADLLIPAVAGLFALYFFWDTWNLKWEARINGILIGVPLLGLIVLKIASMAIAITEGRASMRLGSIAAWTPDQRRRLVLLAVFAGFAMLIGWLGVTLSLFLALLASLWILDVRSPALLVLLPAGTAALVYVLFIAVLDKRMPYGPVENLLAPLLVGGGI
ncbi:tripartite tricarboxylate transporter TctB family protein [Chelativorans salis]|uniref:Tripartite tricarboxylate transporter TctB family protein n=1 Tax=Chelativorans salis TaxID=2978478 RepID=A0ABT2LU02_9HYPH|nr:tripartite tricarboxylate transporter TctB family protein [Chelativorans sp. EGI FJ00035]MCT7376669.1 tripartite tricarboxylate transporter TctB family protein [Chelativorans sp. EGI FJ00035]